MDKYKKFMYIGIFILLISLVGSAGTYAWFTWISPSNTNVTLSIGTLADVTFTSGPDINISNLAPVYNYTDGVSTTFTIRNANSTDSLLYKVKLEITSIANELKDESFKYTLVKDNKVVKTGNLKDTVNGNTLILNTSSLDKGSTSSPKISTFKLYFWIDGNMENNSNMMNKSLVGKIDVGVETNVLTNTESSISSTSKFLNSEIERQNITTLKVVDNLDIPEDATVVDVSKNSDNTIKMWYKEADENGNYNVTIGSNNKIYANPSSTSGLFSNLTNVTSIDLSNMDTSGVTSMKDMFRKDTSLTDIIFGDNFNTSNVTNMNGMFNNCSSLTSLDLSSFDTSSVQTFGINWGNGGMFQDCKNLTNLDLSNFNTSNVTTMTNMFKGCELLTNLDLSNFNTSNVTNMNGMFRNCSSLKNLDLSSFDTSNVKNMGTRYGNDGMFQGCSSLTSLDLSNFDTSNATSMSYMFKDCSSLTSLNLSSFRGDKVTYMTNMFQGCTNLQSVDLSNFKPQNSVEIAYMFSGCKNITSINLKDFKIKGSLNGVFYKCNNLENLNLDGIITDGITSMQDIFFDCSSLKSLDLSSWDVSELNNLHQTFSGASSLENLNISGWKISNKVTSLYGTFDGCKSLKSLDLSGWDTSGVTNMKLTFRRCNSLKSLDLSSFDTSNVTDMSAMFNGAEKLRTIYVSDLWNTSNVTTSYNMFSSCTSLKGAVSYDSSKTDVSMANYTNGYLTKK